MNQMQYPVYYYYQPQPQPAPRPVKEPERFSLSDILFAWFSLLAGYLFCRVFPVTHHPLGGLIFLAVMYLFIYAFLVYKRAKIGIMSIVLTLSVLMISPGLLLVDNAMLHSLIYLFALSVWCYLLLVLGGNTMEPGFSSLLFLDFLKALAILPFTFLGKLFCALFVFRRNGSGRSFLKILLGIALAILPSALIIALLSYDPAFVALCKRVFNLSWPQLISHFISLLFAVPVGMYIYSLYYSSSRKKHVDIITAEQARGAAAGLRIAPQLTAIAATVPILLIYVLFFISQGSFYLSAFSGVLPANFSYAEYAREGFFQLCIVSVINLLIIIALQLFVRRKNEFPSAVTRVLSLIFSSATLILIATALAKLALYVHQFGLTPKRVYAGWFMMVLAVLFLLVILKQIFDRLPLISIGTVAGIACFALLVLSGVDSRIADYNVDRYLEGSLESVDVDALSDLDDAAVPAVVRLVQAMDEKYGTDIRFYTEDSTSDELYNQAAELLLEASDRKEHTFFAFNLPRYRAEKALKEVGVPRVQSFSYADHKGMYRPSDAGVKMSGFVNTDYYPCNSRDRAISRALEEYNKSYKNVSVCLDNSEGVWLVTFYQGEDLLGECFSVYFTYSGKTLMTVAGE